MTKKEGKSFLQDCLKQCQSTVDIDTLICYKYGSSKHASNYQHDTITTDIDSAKERSGIRFIVKCFIHMEIYVAWPVRVSPSNGKYIAYKRDLVSMENDPDCTYKEALIDGTEIAYFFRGQEGVTKFITEHLLPAQ